MIDTLLSIGVAFIAGVISASMAIIFKEKAEEKRRNAYREVDEIYKAIGRVELRVIKLEKARGEA